MSDHIKTFNHPQLGTVTAHVDDEGFLNIEIVDHGLIDMIDIMDRSMLPISTFDGSEILAVAEQMYADAQDYDGS